MRHAEALLFIHDEQAKILEDDILLQELVGADDEIHRAGSEILEGLALLGRGAEAGEDVDIDREALEPLAGGHVVLLSQDRGGDEDGDLLGVHDRLHGGAKGDLGLAEADVAAEQAVHRAGGLHIPLHLGDAAELIVGLGKGEVILKLALPRRIGGKGEACAALALGIELDQAVGQILDRSLCLLLGLFPTVAAELIELDGAVLGRADVFIDEVHLGGGHVEHVRPLVLDFDVILDDPVHLHLLHAHVAADAVELVDDQIAGGQVGEGIELLAVGRLRLRPGTGAPGGAVEKLALGEDGELDRRVLHAVGQGPVGQEDPALGRHAGGREGHLNRDGPVGEILLQDLPPAAAAAEDEGTEAVFPVVLQIGGGDLQIAAVGRELLGDHVQNDGRLHRLREGGGKEGFQEESGPVGNGGADVLPAPDKVAELACQDPALEQAVKLEAEVLLPGVGGAAEVAVVAEDRDPVGGQVVGGGGKVRVDQAHIAVACPEGRAALQLLPVRLQRFHQLRVGLLAPLLAGKQAAQVLAETFHAARMEHGKGLSHGKKDDLIQILGPALGQRVEAAHGIQLVTEEFQADRVVGGGTEDVQDAAAHGKLAHALDQVAAAVARLKQAGGQGVGRAGIAQTERNRRGEQRRPGHGAQGEGLPGGDQQARLAGGKVIEPAQAVLLPLAGDRRTVIEGQVAARKDGILPAQKGSQLRLGPLGDHVVLADDEKGPLELADETGDQVGAVDLCCAGDGCVFAAGQGGADPAELGQALEGVQ